MSDQPFRVGQVSSVNPANNTVRVAFDDMTDPSGKAFVSGEMQMIQRNTVNARNLSLPEVGEHVLCSFLENGSQEGFVHGSYYTGSHMPDADGSGVYRTEYADGTVLEYDLGSSTATVRGSNVRAVVEVREAEVKVLETAKVTAKTIEATAEESVRVTAKTAEVTAETVTITGDVRITGNVTVSGSINASEDIMAAGHSDNHHFH